MLNFCVHWEIEATVNCKENRKENFLNELFRELSKIFIGITPFYWDLIFFPLAPLWKRSYDFFDGALNKIFSL